MLADNVLEALWFGEDDSDAAEAEPRNRQPPSN